MSEKASVITKWLKDRIGQFTPTQEALFDKLRLHMFTEQVEQTMFNEIAGRVASAEKRCLTPFSILFLVKDNMGGMTPSYCGPELFAEFGPLPIDSGGDLREVLAKDAEVLYKDRLAWIQRVLDAKNPYAIIIAHPIKIMGLPDTPEGRAILEKQSSFEVQPNVSPQQAAEELKNVASRMGNSTEAISIFCMSPQGRFATMRPYKVRQKGLAVQTTATYIDDTMVGTKAHGSLGLLQAWACIKPWWPVEQGGHGN